MATQEEPPNKEKTCDSGYRCLFKDGNIQDRFKCSSCKRVSRNPHNTCCGGPFCAQYIRELEENEECCPECKEKYESISSRKIHKEILKFEVFCVLRDQGCKWEGVVKEIDEHNDVCEYGFVPCPQNCGHDNITRGSLDEHVKQECPEREYSCPHCNFKDTYKFVTNAHLTECSYKPVACPNNCGVKGERDDMETHLQNECLLEYRECKLGCSMKIRREDEPKHFKESVPEHVVWLADKTLRLNEMIVELTAKNELQLRENEEIKEQLEDFIAQQEQANEKGTEEREELKTQLEQERSRLELLEKQVSNMTNNAQQDDISPPEQSGDVERREIRDLERKSDEKEKELEQLRAKLDKHETESNEQITRLNTKVAKMEQLLKSLSTPPPLAVLGVPAVPHQQDDHLSFTLDNYNKRKEDGGEWSSPPFPAFENGPQLSLIVWLNGQGEGKGTHISAWLAQLAQEFEAGYSTEPLQITLKLELICQDHQTPNITSKNDFLFPDCNRYVGYFSNKFIAHSHLRNGTGYLVDDKLEFHITCTRVCIPDVLQDGHF